jgi:CRISPR-associated exonuclease Cas4
MLLGDMVHLGLEKLMVELGSGWKAEVPVEKVFNVDGTEYRVLGRIDLVQYEDSRPLRVVEIKTVRQLQAPTPYEHHVMQLKVYLELLNVDEGYLVYITPERAVEFRIERGGVDVEELVRQTVYDVSKPRFNWECRYCAFRRICPFAKQVEERES